MLCVQCVKSPGGNCPVRVNVLYHLLDIPYHTLLVGQDGLASFALVVAPYCELTSWYVRLFLTEDLAEVCELSKGDLLLDRWYIVEFLSY